MFVHFVLLYFTAAYFVYQNLWYIVYANLQINLII